MVPGLLIVLLFAVAASVLTFPLLLHLGSAVRDPGDPLLNTWILAWDVHALSTHPLGLYQANIFYPFPASLTYSEVLIGGAIFAAPVIWLTGNPVLAHNLLTIASFALSGLGAYSLSYHLTRYRAGAILAGISFAFCSYRFDQLSHLQLLLIQWLPFALLFLHRGFASGRASDFLWFAVFFVLQALSSFYYAFFATIVVGVFLVYELLTNRASRRLAILWRFSLALVVCGVLIVPFGLPYFASEKMFGFQRNLDEVQDLSASFQDFFAAPPENILYGAVTAPFASRTKWPQEHFLFPGLVGPMLAVAGLVTLRRPRAVAPWPFGASGRRYSLLEIELHGTRDQLRYLVLLVAAFLLALGPHLQVFGHLTGIPLPYLVLYDYVPGFTAMRAPVRFDVVVMLALAVLSSYGLANLATYVRRWIAFARWRTMAESLIVLGAAAELVTVPVPLSPVAVGSSVPAVYGWLARHDPTAPVAEMPLGQAQDFLYEYYSAYHWHPIVNGQSGFVPPGYPEIAAAVNAFPSPVAVADLAALGVRYVVVHGDRVGRQQRQSIREQAEAGRGVRLVRTLGADDVYELSPRQAATLSAADVVIDFPRLIGRNAPASVLVTLRNPTANPMTFATTDAVAKLWWNQGQSSTVVRQPLPVFVGPGDAQTIGLPIDARLAPGAHQLTLELTSPLETTATSAIEIVDRIPTSRDRFDLAAVTRNWVIPAKIGKGQPFTIEVVATNTGRAEWLAHAPNYNGQVGLGIRGWYAENGQLVPGPGGVPLGGRGWLTTNVLPGQTVSCVLQAVAPSKPGLYRLQVDLVSEYVTWFSDVHHGSEVERTVEVVP